MRKLFKIVITSSLALLCFSCYYDEFLEKQEVIIDPEDDVSFANDIVPIIISYNCAQCHNGNQDPDLRAGNEYSSLVPDYVIPNNADDSELYQVLAIENHRELDAISLALIKEWIDRGAENN